MIVVESVAVVASSVVDSLNVEEAAVLTCENLITVAIVVEVG